MKISTVQNANHLIEITSPSGEVFNVGTHDLLAAIAATVGPQHWLNDLIQAHMKLAYDLSLQNAGVNGTEPYSDNEISSYPKTGLAMETLSSSIANQLINLRDATTNPQSSQGVDLFAHLDAEGCPL